MSNKISKQVIRQLIFLAALLMMILYFKKNMSSPKAEKSIDGVFKALEHQPSTQKP